MNIIKHSFRKAGGLQLGIQMQYPQWVSNDGVKLQKCIVLKLSFIVITLEFYIKYGKKKSITY